MTGNSDGLSATPSNWPNNPDRPVEKVSWDDIQVFLTFECSGVGQYPCGVGVCIAHQPSGSPAGRGDHGVFVGR